MSLRDSDIEPTYNEIEISCVNIALEAQEKTNNKIDCVVALSRGGIIAASMISHMIEGCDVVFMDYTTTEVLNLPPKVFHYKNILVIDDIANTGKRMSDMQTLFGVYDFDSVTYSVLYKNQKEFVGDIDIVARSIISDSKVVFPWMCA